MAILNIQTVQTGLVGVLPSLAYISTSDPEATVLTSGYLNKEVANGTQFSMPCIAAVTTQATPTSQPKVGWFQVAHVAPNWSLVPTGSPGNVVLPTIANHIATYTDALGTLGEDPATAISGGNIQAGLSGTAGYLASFPSALAKGSLRLTAVANTSDTLVTISNALHGQASVYSIPDSGSATANFIISKLTGTQHITVGGLQVDAGALISGLSTGGFVGKVQLFPTTTTTGSLTIQATPAGGNFASTITNAAFGQAVAFTIPDPGAASASFVLSASGAGQTIAGGLTISTGNLAVSQGNVTAGSDAHAGTVSSFPSTTANGSLILAAVNAGGAFNTTISNGTMGQSTVYTIPDVSAATGQFLVKTAALVNGNLIQASGTAGLTIDSGVATTDVQLKSGVKANTTADIGGAGAGPISVVVAGLTAASPIVATIASSSNAVAVAKCIGTATGFDITFTGDPGAACVVNYVAYIAAQ